MGEEHSNNLYNDNRAEGEDQSNALYGSQRFFDGGGAMLHLYMVKRMLCSLNHTSFVRLFVSFIHIGK
jgi:hypothetical protein